MAGLTTTRTGNWSDTGVGTTPWAALTGSGPGGVAGLGDTALVSSSNTLTCDGTQNIGTNGPNAPAAAPTVSASAGATPTNLPTGNYYVRIVAVNANGESTCSAESAVLALTNGVSTPRIVLPSLPIGGTSWSVYITNTGTAAGGLTHRRYATGQSAGNFEPVSASWEDGTVAFASAKALAPASGIWATGILNFAAGASLTCAGDIQTTNTSGSTMSAGAALTLSVPSGQTFYFSPGGFTNGNQSPLIASGSSGSRCTISKTGSGTASLSALPFATGFNGRGVLRLDHADVYDIGSASVDAGFCAFYVATDYRLTNSTFTRCGRFNSSNGQPDQTIIVTNSRWSNSVGTTSLLLAPGATYTSGTRRLQYNSFDQAFQFGATPTNFVMDDNFFGNNVVMSGATAGPTSFTHNFWGRVDFAQNTTNLYFGCNDNIYHITSSSTANPHGLDPAVVNADTTVSGWVFDGITPDNTGDLILPSTGAKANPYTLTLKNNLCLPNLAGDNLGTPCTLYGNAKLQVVFEHNTFCMGIQGFSYGEAGGYAGAANMIPSYQSNCAYNISAFSGQGFLLFDGLSSPFDATAGQVTVCDYNGKYNHATTTSYPNADSTVLAKGYLTSTVAFGKYVFVQTPANVGAHDITADPQFYDRTRSTQTFDQGYLGYPVATAWASGQTFAKGDIRSSIVVGNFFSLPINYRCIVPHTSTASGATGQPGTGSAVARVAWSDYWEPASLEYIRQAVVAGTLYDGRPLGGSNNVSLIEILRLWIRKGFAPTNPLYKNAGHDGVTIGAVEGVFAANSNYIPIIRRRRRV